MGGLDQGVPVAYIEVFLWDLWGPPRTLRQLGYHRIGRDPFEQSWGLRMGGVGHMEMPWNSEVLEGGNQD